MPQLVYRYGISLDDAGFVHYINVLNPLNKGEQHDEIMSFARANKVSPAGLRVKLIDKLPSEQFEWKYNNAENEFQE